MENTQYLCGVRFNRHVQFQISVGKMWLDCKKQKGVLDKAPKIPLHKENDYDEVLRTCIEHVSYNMLSENAFLYILLL